jgi:uncharacterized protein
VRVEWDVEKDRANQKKHKGITFEMAEEVFRDPNQIVLENYYFEYEGEQRYQIIGMTQNLLLLLVIFVDRSIAHEQTVRIISARKATAYEQGIYQDQFR